MLTMRGEATGGVEGEAIVFPQNRRGTKYTRHKREAETFLNRISFSPGLNSRVIRCKSCAQMARQDRCGARTRTNITGHVHRDAVDIFQGKFIEQAQNQ